MNTRIKKLRKALDLTQQAFADKLGVKRNTVATYETGKSNPSDAAIVLICREFHVNEAWLRTGEGEMFQSAPRDALDELIAQYRLPREYRALTEKFIELTPAQQDTVVEYMRKVAAALMEDEYPPRQKAAERDGHPDMRIHISDFPAAPPENWTEMPPVDPNRHPDAPPWAAPGWAPEKHAVWAEEARAEAERVYREILEEKKAESESSAFPPGGSGTA